jgi:hypothetical protein
MKELHIGDISIFTDDEDSWDEIIKVVKKVNRAYQDSVKLKSLKSWIERLIKKGK